MGKARNDSAQAGPGRPARLRAGRRGLCRTRAAARVCPRASAVPCRPSGARGHRGGAQGPRALPERAQPLPIPVGLPEGRGRSLEDFLGWAKQELRPVLNRMLRMAAEQDILRPQAIYGYWKCAGAGQRRDPVPGGRHHRSRPLHPAAPAARTTASASPTSCATSATARASRRDRPSGRHGGPEGGDMAREWFEENRYQDYLYLHGLGVEMAEAMAEYVHKRIRADWVLGRGRPRHGKDAPARLPRQPLFLRLSRPAPGWRTRTRC